MTPEQLFALICFTDSVECVNKIIFCLCRAHNQYDLTKNLTQFQRFRKPSNSFIYSLYTNQHSSYSPSEAAKRNQSERTHMCLQTWRIFSLSFLYIRQWIWMRGFDALFFLPYGNFPWILLPLIRSGCTTDQSRWRLQLYTRKHHTHSHSCAKIS